MVFGKPCEWPSRCSMSVRLPGSGSPCVVEPEMTMTLLESLKKYTTVVADTGAIEAIARHRPQDATTNPSLLSKAAQMLGYRHLVEEAETLAVRRGGNHRETAEEFIDRLFVLFRSEERRVGKE